MQILKPGEDNTYDDYDPKFKRIPNLIPQYQDTLIYIPALGRSFLCVLVLNANIVGLRRLHMVNACNQKNAVSMPMEVSPQQNPVSK